jgi:hypothetical protein
MVTADLIALAAALATAAASRTPPPQPLTHVTDMQLRDGLAWFQLQQQQAADAAPQAGSQGNTAESQGAAPAVPAAAAAAAASQSAGSEAGGGVSCPWCGLPGLTPAGLWYHVPLHHCYHDNLAGRCPVCKQ